jgi:hypothetical protein
VVSICSPTWLVVYGQEILVTQPLVTLPHNRWYGSPMIAEKAY